VEETLCYMAFPREHWTRIRTNNMLERIMREIRRRTRVVGNFPDGPSAVMLVAARLGYVAATRWGGRPYLDRERLRDQGQEEQPTQFDEPLQPELVPPRGNQVRLPHTTNSQTKCAHLDRHYPLSVKCRSPTFLECSLSEGRLSMSTTSAAIPGYDFGKPTLGRSPVALEDLSRLHQATLFTAEDERYLRLAGEVLADQVEEILDLWYGFVGAHPFLVQHFLDQQGQPLADYLAAVRKRFGQWILDTCRRPHDQDWLNYQHEIGLRHHRSKKNQTDHVAAASQVVPLRYLIALIAPITITIRDFLGKKGHSAAEVDKMYHAWFKAVVLQVALWSQPYARDGDY